MCGEGKTEVRATDTYKEIEAEIGLRDEKLRSIQRL
jgi:hypothetical protein